MFGLPKGSYSLKDTHNDYEMEQEPNVWAMDSTKSIEPKVSTPQSLNHHSSPIHLNIFESQSSKVDFLLSSSMEESILCDENQAVLESVDGLVSERLRSMSDHLHANVPIIGRLLSLLSIYLYLLMHKKINIFRLSNFIHIIYFKCLSTRFLYESWSL